MTSSTSPRPEIRASPTETAARTGRRLGHRPGLDGLRGVAVLMVLAVHSAGRYFPGGALGVDVFFVLSGFLISRVLMEERAATGLVSLRSFYARRGLRLLPALLLVLLFVAVASRLLASVGKVRQLVNWWDLIGPLLYVQNWVRIAYFDTPMLMAHAWSLAVEEQFYLVWPLVLIVVLHRTTVPVVVARWLCAAIFVAALVMVMRSVLGASMVALYYGSESVGSLMLLTGAVVAFWFEQSDGRACRLQRIVSWACVPAAALIGTLGLTVRVEKACFLYLGGWLVVAAAVAIVLVAALDDSSLTGQLLAVHPLRWVGKISYGLYLWHFPLLYLIQYALVPQGFRSAVIAAIAVPAAVGMATLSFYLLERPINRAGRARLQRFEQCHLRRASSWP